MELKTKYVDWYLMKLNMFVIFELQGVHDEFDTKGVERSMILWDDIDKAEFNELIYYTYNRCKYENCLDSYTNYYYLCGEYCKGVMLTPIRLLLKFISSLIRNYYFDFVTDVLIF